MSFTKTVSVVAALASIFGAATAGWKLTEASSQQPVTELDQKLTQLDQKLEDLSKPAPVTLPQTPPAAPVLTPVPDHGTIPHVEPPPPVPEETQP
jgi:hypothetical protein